MGQCSSESSCSEDLCRRSHRRPEAAPSLAKNDEALAGEESSPSQAELPSELAGAVAKAVEASQEAQKSLATLSVPKCKSKGVQTEPVTPETEVLPETFFVPDGEPWELAPSTVGSERCSEIDFRADPALGLSGVDAFGMEPGLKGRKQPPRLSEDLIMSGLLPEPRDALSVCSVTSSRSSPSLILQRWSTGNDAVVSVARRRSGRSAAGGSTLESPEVRLAEIQEDQGPVVPSVWDPDAPDVASQVVRQLGLQGLVPKQELADANPLADEADARRFLVEHEGVWLQKSDEVPVAAFRDLKLWKKDVAYPTVLEALPGHRVQIPGHTARIVWGPPAELQWSDGSTWIQEELQGRWSSLRRPKKTLVIRDWKVYWDSKVKASPTSLSRVPIFPRSAVTMFLDRECSGIYDPGPPAKLEWSDGEVWSRLSLEEKEVIRPATQMLP